MDANGQATATTAPAPAAQGQAAQAQQAPEQQAQQPAPAEQGQQQAPAAQQQGQEQKQPGQQAQPIDYGDFETPEGITLDSEVITGFKDIAQKHGLSKDAAQEFVSSLAPTIAKQQQAQLEQAIANARNQWVESVKADKELGGEAMENNMAVARRAFDQFGTPELKQVLNESGLGDNPEIIRWAYRVGKAITQDNKFVGQGSITKGSKDPRSLYPNSNHAA